jgi:hypothetical protein
MDSDPEINIFHQLGVEHPGCRTARSMHPRGILSIVPNPTQWDTHVSNVSTDDQGQAVIAPRFAPPDFKEFKDGMSATEITHRSQNEEQQDSGRLNDRLTEPKTSDHGQRGRNDQAHYCPPHSLSN